MLDWFNAVFTIFREFVAKLFDLTFYGVISVGSMLLAVIIFSILLDILINRIK